MKKILLFTTVLLSVFLLTGCGGALSTTIIEHDITSVEEISGRMVITVEARGDRVRTWEVITHYHLEEYLEAYGYEDTEAVREWFSGTGPSAMIFNGMEFELVDITDSYVVTRMFYDYTVISRADRERIIGTENDYISLSQSIQLHRISGARITTEE